MFRAGQMMPAEDLDLRDRVPVVASGSNGSPQRLAEKYGETAEIPVTFGTIREMVPVFAARVTSYGSIPATLAISEGASAGVHVTWLTDAQLDIMHITESAGVGYAYVKLANVDLDLGIHGNLDQAYAYLSIQGAFKPHGSLLPLHEISQQTAHRHVMRCCGFDGELTDFIARHLQDPGFRKDMNARLADFGQPIEHPDIERLV